jgi:cyanophycinase
LEAALNEATTTGPVALVGSGEYLETMAGIEGDLIAGRPPRYVQIATAAVPDGDDTVARWHALGATQAARLGVEQVVVPVVNRADAERDDFARLIVGAGLIYLSGGHPDYLADVLRDTPVWDAIVTAWRSGAALAGCSAGAMVMATWIPSWRDPSRDGTAGLGLVPHIRVIPHFDRFIARAPELVARITAPPHDGVTLIGVDEETALVGGPTHWDVRGRQSAWVLSGEERTQFATGSTLDTPDAP